jgi:NAD(P)H-dependent flavin oxidoreductase YrpB (nitropropane dioxygenase family)
MLKTPLCDLFDIEIPIILAPMGTCTSAEFAAAVSNEGGLGGIGSLFRSTAAVKRDIDTIRKFTSRPFAINHIPQRSMPKRFAIRLRRDRRSFPSRWMILATWCGKRTMSDRASCFRSPRWLKPSKPLNAASM